MLWRVRGKRRIVFGVDFWRGFLGEGSSFFCCFFRCFSRWVFGLWWLCEMERIVRVSERSRGVIWGLFEEGLNVKVYRCKKEF